MSERERWIVYPLLFFALGASIRDKILHRVDTKEIYCESLKIVDQQDPMRKPLVELSIERIQPDAPRTSEGQYGRLRLVDTQGREFCLIDNSSVTLADSQESGAQEICLIGTNNVSLVNRQQPGKESVAELSIQEAKKDDPLRIAERSGTLRLADSDGRIVCSLDEIAEVRRVISKRLDIIDEVRRPRVVATTEPAPAMNMPNELGTMATQGVIWLNDERRFSKLTPPAKQQPIPTVTP